MRLYIISITSTISRIMTADLPTAFIFKEHYAPREIHRQLSGIDPQRPLFISAAVGKYIRYADIPIRA